MIDNKLLDETSYLFNRSYDEDLSSEEEEAIEERAEQMITEYGWENTFSAWEQYLKENCITPESVINFANLFWWYGGQDHPIPEPHKFLGYFYYRINMETSKYDEMDILDSLSTTILKNAGFREADLVLNTQYMPENDPKIIAEVENYRKQGV